MIKEDYVSLEVAKLLKEKGFDIECNTAYFNGSLIDYTLYGFCDGELIHCPTLQMAMKWLREEKDVLITYDLAGPIGSKLLVKVYRKDYDLDWIEATTIIRETLEEAINTAIHWSLENLITN